MQKGPDEKQRQDSRRLATHAERLSAQDLAKRLPSASILPRPLGWDGLDLQMYRHPPGAVATPGNLDHVLVLHVGGDAIIDDVTAGRRRRSWAGAGCVSLTPAGHPVVRSWRGHPEVLLVYLKTALVDGVAHDLGLRPGAVELMSPLAERDPQLHHLGALLHAEAAHAWHGSALKVEYLAKALAVHLLQAHSNVSDTKPRDRSGMNRHRLSNAVDYMRVSLDKPIRLAELAGACGLSATHFSREFRLSTGLPPHAFLVELRLQKALQLLEYTAQSITEIAVNCGFEQPQYFATVFRRKFGQSPSTWRNAHKH